MPYYLNPLVCSYLLWPVGNNKIPTRLYNHTLVPMVSFLGMKSIKFSLEDLGLIHILSFKVQPHKSEFVGL